MKKIALARIKDSLSKYLKLAEREEIIITRHRKPAGCVFSSHFLPAKRHLGMGANS